MIDMGFLYQFNLRLHHYYSLFSTFKKNVFKKLAGLWLVGEVVNHLCFMDLTQPRVARPSNVGFVIHFVCAVNHHKLLTHFVFMLNKALSKSDAPVTSHSHAPYRLFPGLFFFFYKKRTPEHGAQAAL